ncbi:MAG: MoaD/ThiS family protein [Pseudonocardiaceae bacterium]
MAAVTVRYFAGARAAAGRYSELVELSDATTVSDVLAEVTRRHGDDLKRILGGCSYLLDGIAVRELGIGVPAGAELDVLPPFAGG